MTAAFSPSKEPKRESVGVVGNAKKCVMAAIPNESAVMEEPANTSCLSLMTQEVHRDGTTTAVKGQRSGIFQSECKIKGKVCKLIIDGGSSTNVISSDLVSALALSMRRFLTPHYVQWMNQSGTLKITHKARVKFAIGNYMDTIDCDVVAVSACHLLLGRPW
jgi:predicted aspartyl protease